MTMNWENALFGGWPAVARTAVTGVLAYAVLVMLLRGSGKRTLSKFNAFDFVVTVALGSTLASVLLSDSVALAQGVAAFVVLIGLQFAITWLSVRSTLVRRIVKGEPTLLLHRGQFLAGALRRERITPEEVRAAARAHGAGSLAQVDSAVLETDGTITIVQRDHGSRAVAAEGERGSPLADEGGSV